MSGDVAVHVYYGNAPIQICYNGVDLTVYTFFFYSSLNAPEQLVINNVLG